MNKHWLNFEAVGPQPPPPFVGSYISNLTLATNYGRGIAHSPVNGQVYYANFTAKLVCRIDPSGAGSLLTDIATTNSPRYLAYLPVSDKILVVYGTNNYQLIDCATNTIGALTAFSAGFSISGQQASNSFAVNPVNDDVYICSSHEIRKLTPSTGVMTGTGFATYAWLWNDEVLEVAFNPADGYVYAAFTNGRLKVLTPSNWALAPIIDHSTPSLDVNSRLWINRASGKVWLSSNAGANKHYYADAVAVADFSTANTPGGGDYDNVVEGVFALQQAAVGIIKQYSNADVLAVTTTVGNNLVNPLEIAAVPALGRYVLFRAAATSVDIVAR